MNKTKLAISALILTLSTTAQADFAGIYAGAQRWNHDIDGSINSLGPNIDLNQDLGLNDGDANIYYVAIEHPIPFIPNVKVQQNDLNGNSIGTATQDFTFQSGSYITGSTIATSYDFNHTDYTFYYEILDNWVNLDLGFSAKDFDGFVDIRPDGQVIPGVNTRVNISGTVPMVYGKAQFDLPFTGYSAGGEIQVGQFEDDELSDMKAYVAYESDSGLGFEAGYRAFELEFDDFDGLSSDLTIDGFYAALTIHF